MRCYDGRYRTFPECTREMALLTPLMGKVSNLGRTVLNYGVQSACRVAQFVVVVSFGVVMIADLVASGSNAVVFAVLRIVRPKGGAKDAVQCPVRH